jgi:hypothetical protein
VKTQETTQENIEPRMVVDKPCHDAEWRYWIREQGAEGNIVGTGEEMEQVVTEVKIALPDV